MTSKNNFIYMEDVEKKSRLYPSNSNSSSNNRKYNSIPSNRFYTEREEVTLRFYQVPKALFKNPRYKGLSLGPKLMYSILRDRLDLSIKNRWKDENGYIYLVFSVEELMDLLEMSNKIIIKYKKRLARYGLIFEKRIGQGKANRIYILKPELQEFQKCRKYTSRSDKSTPLEMKKIHSNDTYVNETDLNNVNRANRGRDVEKSKGKINEYPLIKKYGSRKKEQLAKEIAEELNDNYSLGAFLTIADKISEQRIRIFLSIIKDTYLTGRIKKNRGAMFISLAKSYAVKNGINLNFKSI